MMKHALLRTTFLSLSALLLAAGISRAALDLTPVAGFKILEGMQIPIVQFSDGDKKINYKPPGGWSPVGGGKSVSFVPPDVTGAVMKIMAVAKHPPAEDAPAEPAEDLQAFARQFIPPGAKEPAFVKQVPGPFQLEGRETQEFIFTYALSGIRESISVSVTDRSETERVVVIFSARQKDFDTLNALVISSMFSWKIAGGSRVTPPQPVGATAPQQ